MQEEIDENIDLTDLSLAESLAALESLEVTGLLLVGTTGEVWLSEGMVYLARTPASDDLADVLVATGAIDQAEAEGLLQTGSPGATDELSEQHPASIPILDRLLHEHNLSALFELLVPEQSTYSFEHNTVHAIGQRFAEPTAQLVAQAQSRMQIWSKIANAIPSTDIAFRLTPSLPSGQDEYLVSADQWRYLALLDGPTTVSDLIRLTGESAFKVCSTLYRLILEGLIVQT